MRNSKLLVRAAGVLMLVAVLLWMPARSFAAVSPSCTLDASKGSASVYVDEFPLSEDNSFENSQMLIKSGKAGIYELNIDNYYSVDFYAYTIYDAKGNYADVDTNQIVSEYSDFDTIYLNLEANSTYYISWYMETESSYMAAVFNLDYLDECGDAGPDIRSSYNKSTKTLTLKGTGSTWDALDTIVWDTRFPWETSGPIEKVVIGEGIERIGSGMFYDLESLKSIDLPSTLRTIGQGAFMRKTHSGATPYTCTIPFGVRKIDNWAFLDECREYPAGKLTDVALPATIDELGDNIFGWDLNTSRIRLVSASKMVEAYAEENGIAFQYDSGVMHFQGAKKIDTNAYEISVTAGKSLSIKGKVLFGDAVMPDSFFYAVGPYIPGDDEYIDPSPYAVSDWGNDKIVTKAPGIVYLSFNSKEFGGYEQNDFGFNLKIIIKPSATSIASLTNTSDGIKVSWEEVANAGGYQVYRSKNGGSYSLIKTISKKSTVSYTDTEATTNGAKYQYKVTAYKKVNGERCKASASSVETVYRLSRPSISSAKNSSAKAVKVSWKKNSKATGYQVKYVLGSTKKTVTIKDNETLKKTVSGLKKGKTYKFYVRSYKTVNDKKYYSAWSKAKSVKIEK